MANPSNKGIGTGAAQVYDYSRIDRAAENAMKVVGAKQAAIKKDEAVKDKALRELQGDYGVYDTSNIREADKQPLIDSINEGRKLIDGHWGDVVNGDPYWTSVYQNQVMQQKKAIGDSATMKKKMASHYAKANEPESGYSPERIKRYNELALVPGVTDNQLKDEGLWGRDQVIGNILVKADKSFADKGNELYKMEDVSYTNADGGSSSREEKKWLDDAEALPKFREAIEGDVELMQDMNIQYGGLPMEEQVENFYNDYKTSRINEWKKTRVKATPTKEPKAGGGAGEDVTGAEFILDNKVEGFKLASNKNLKSISFTIPAGQGNPEQIVNLTPSSFYKKGGKWRVRGNVSRGSWNELTSTQQEEYGSKEKFLATTKKGDAKDVVMNPVIEAAVKAQYGIEDMDSYLKMLKGGNTQEETAKDKGSKSAAPKKGSVVNGYKFLGGDPKNQKNWKKI